MISYSALRGLAARHYGWVMLLAPVVLTVTAISPVGLLAALPICVGLIILNRERATTIDRPWSGRMASVACVLWTLLSHAMAALPKIGGVDTPIFEMLGTIWVVASTLWFYSSLVLVRDSHLS
jgi:hypothetical protein